MIADLKPYPAIKDFGVVWVGKLPEHRHPVNNYRLFKLADVEKLRQQIELPVSSERKTRGRNPR